MLGLSIIPAIGWGMMPIFAKKSKANPDEQLLGTIIIALIFNMAFYIIYTPCISMNGFMVGFFSGGAWAIGQKLQFEAIDRLQVEKVMPISNGSQVIGTTIVSAYLFSEWKTRLDYLIGFCGIAMLILGMIFTNFQEKENSMLINRERSKKFNNYLRVIVIILISSFALVLYVTIPKFYNVSSTELILPQGIGMFVMSIFIMLPNIKTIKKKNVKKNFITGISWSIANFSFFLISPILGVAKSFAISQFAVIVSIFGGIFFLKVNKTKKEIIMICFGSVLIICGIIVISLIQ